MKIDIYQSLKTALLATLNRENETHYRMRDIDHIWISTGNIELQMNDGECFNVYCCINL